MFAPAMLACLAISAQALPAKFEIVNGESSIRIGKFRCYIGPQPSLNVRLNNNSRLEPESRNDGSKLVHIWNGTKKETLDLAASWKSWLASDSIKWDDPQARALLRRANADQWPIYYPNLAQAVAVGPNEWFGIVSLCIFREGAQIDEAGLQVLVRFRLQGFSIEWIRDIGSLRGNQSHSPPGPMRIAKTPKAMLILWKSAIHELTPKGTIGKLLIRPPWSVYPCGEAAGGRFWILRRAEPDKESFYIFDSLRTLAQVIPATGREWFSIDPSSPRITVDRKWTDLATGASGILPARCVGLIWPYAILNDVGSSVYKVYSISAKRTLQRITYQLPD